MKDLKRCAWTRKKSLRELLQLLIVLSIFNRYMGATVVWFYLPNRLKKLFFIFFFFGERECIFTRFLSSSAVIRAGATTSTVSLMALLLSFVTYNLQ